MHERGASEENNASIGGKRPLVIATYGKQGIELRAFVSGIHAKSGHRQFFAAGARRIGVENRQVRHRVHGTESKQDCQ